MSFGFFASDDRAVIDSNPTSTRMAMAAWKRMWLASWGKTMSPMFEKVNARFWGFRTRYASAMIVTAKSIVSCMMFITTLTLVDPWIPELHTQSPLVGHTI